MKQVKTFYIKRNGVFIWLGQDVKPLETDEIIEIRNVLVADEGKVLKSGEEIYKSFWTDNINEFEEIDEPVIVEEEDEPAEPTEL